VYPNPAKEKLNIDLISASAADVIVYDALGKTVYKTTADHPMTINTASWNRGIYFIKVTTEKGVSSSKIVLE
ncbi:MAG: T9SS type A sorting domain-containing protein, partial [Bacteroidia bacterium]